MLTIFRKYFPPIHIHPILLIFIVISFLTGTFVELIIILSIVLIHELGHYVMSQFFHWRVESIMLWVFGGVMKTDEHGNKSIYEETFVTIAGPLQHVLIYGILFIFSAGHVFPASLIKLMYHYNTIILIFNLLPIWPLDGGKLLFIGLSTRLPYRKAYEVSLITSMILSILILTLFLLLYPFTLSAFLMMLFLFMESYQDWKRRQYVFIRFLLNRYQGNHIVKAVYPLSVLSTSTLMEVFSLFKRERKHPLYVTYPNNERKQLDESDCLRRYFYEKKYDESIGDIANQTFDNEVK